MMLRSVRLLSTLRRIYACRTISNSSNTGPDEMDQLKKNPYFSKYAERLLQKEQENPDDFEKSVEKIKAEKERQLELKRLDAEDTLKRAQEEKAKGLDGIVKLDLLRERTADEIKEIWLQRHKNKPCIFGVMTADEFEQFQNRMTSCPLFLYPLPSGDGYQFMFQQFENLECHFTPLALYQHHKENAPQCLNMRYYTEILEDKGIVLMNSEINTDIISVSESQLLALQVQLYYGMNAAVKFEIVNTFNKSPSQFNHLQLVQEFEKCQQDLKPSAEGTWV